MFRTLALITVGLTLAGLAAGLVFASLVEWDWLRLATAVVGGALFANAFLLIWFVTRRFLGLAILGFGDVRLAALLGIVSGWYGLAYIFYGALAGHLLALAVAVATCIRKRKPHLRDAFGPPLIAGTLAVVLFHA